MRGRGRRAPRSCGGRLYPPIGQAKILTSGLLRTEQTLRLLYGDVPHEVWPELREISFGIFEGKSYDELNGRADYAAWLAGDWFGNVPPGGESFAQAQARILAGLARMQAQGEDILAVVHGGTVLTIMQALFPEEEKNGYEWQPRPGGGYPPRPRSPHLDPHRHPTLKAPHFCEPPAAQTQGSLV